MDVSVITPTVPSRRDLLLNRCIPSVKAQTIPVEHIIVCDGPLEESIEGVLELSRNWRAFLDLGAKGAFARHIGCAIAKGRWICYLDDDNEYLPHHVETLLNAVERAGTKAGWSKGINVEANCYIGDTSTPRLGNIDTSSIIHSPELFKYRNWMKVAEIGRYEEDWVLVSGWLEHGVEFTWVDEVTYKYYKNS
ncbi:MAG: glycosyltransferase family 2 protein [Gammaproteobacteria bacterium]|nr:MAG: glycosyltransferase family 2 protein [Gammaproteobacteria bacterium]